MRGTLIKQLRDMTVRSLALAQTFRENGNAELSDQLIAEAIKCDDQANALELAAKRK